MNKQEVTTQGYLAAYITGELSDEEVREVESLIDSDVEVRDEFFELQKTVELIAFETGILPDAAIKRSIMEDPSVMGQSHLPPSIKGSSTDWKWMIAASMTAVVSLLCAFYFWNEWKTTDTRLAELTARNLELAESYQIVNQELTNVREDLAVLISPEFSRIILNGTQTSPDSKAVIYWNPVYEEVYLSSANLAELPQDQQYQLWALIDGQPVDAGVFDAEVGTFQIMKGIAKADAFAVTVEKAGGSPSPTLETMKVYGETKS